MSVAESPELATPREAARTRLLGAAAILAGLAAIKLLLHFAGIRSYGFFRDELYYLACGQHLAWGYIDQPPLIAGVAWFARHAMGGSIVAVRLLPVLAGTAVVVLTGLLARELGGGRFALWLAALTILFAPGYLAFDSFLSMNAFEPLFWVLGAWLLVRIVKGGSPHLWLVFGVVAGIGLENKHTMLAFGFGLVCGLILGGQGRWLLTRWAWIAAAIALLIFLPNLIWEAQHGWPQIEVVRNAKDYKNVPVPPARFLFEQMLFLDPVALPVWAGGLAWLLAAGKAKPFRFLGFAYLIVMGIVMAFGEKTYYPLPAYTMLAAAGGVAFEEVTAERHRWLRYALPTLVAAGGLAGAPLAVPVLPIQALLRYSGGLPFARVQTERDATVQLSQLYADMLPWENTTRQIAAVYDALPASDRAGCAILAGNYGEAGAIDYYGPALGLPRVLSGHNSYYDWGPRGYTGKCMIIFGERAQEFTQYFGDVRLATTISNPGSMPIEQSIPVYICRKPRAPLAVLWPKFKMVI